MFSAFRNMAHYNSFTCILQVRNAELNGKRQSSSNISEELYNSLSSRGQITSHEATAERHITQLATLSTKIYLYSKLLNNKYLSHCFDQGQTTPNHWLGNKTSSDFTYNNYHTVCIKHRTQLSSSYQPTIFKVIYNQCLKI